MQIIEIEDEEVLDIYCPFCGKHSLDKEGVEEPCVHLQWVDSSETLGDAWYKSDTFPDLTGDLDEYELLDALQRRFPDSSAILFLLGGTSPENPAVYLLYQSTA